MTWGQVTSLVMICPLKSQKANVGGLWGIECAMDNKLVYWLMMVMKINFLSMVEFPYARLFSSLV